MMQRLLAVGLVASLSSLSPVLSSVGSSTLDVLSSATSSGSSVSELSSQVLDDDRLASSFRPPGRCMKRAIRRARKARNAHITLKARWWWLRARVG
ncbi:hypothetical protein [Corynebacterium cystitidis]|uniref:hypothetical protein n=1 Tax=Corynebacterium cystitidis TaxID=35757 RepID=UPI00115FB7C3|nr:hypothetical protein [Corynebacterium cystitidis]